MEARNIVVLVEERALTRECLAGSLGQDFEIVAISRVAELDQHLEQGDEPDLVVLSIGSSKVSDASIRGTLKEVSARLPNVPVSIISDCEEVDAITEAVLRGIQGYIPTTTNLPVATEVLRLMQRGGTFFPASSLMTLLEEWNLTKENEDMHHAAPLSLEGMTLRQSQVLEFLRQGKPNKIIAYALDLKESTVKVHVHHIMKKLRATNRTEAAFLAQQLFNAQKKPSGPAELADEDLADTNPGTLKAGTL